MSPLDLFSPTLTATSSTSRARTDIDNLPDLDVVMEGVEVPDINDLFNFDEYESANDSHSAATISPNQTPSPQPAAHSPLAVPGSPTFNYQSNIDFSTFDFMNEKEPEAFSFPTYPDLQTELNNLTAGPSSFPSLPPADIPSTEFTVKSEPIDFWDAQRMSGGFNIQATATPVILPPSTIDTSSSSSGSTPAPMIDFNGLPADQQAALQQLMFNMMAYQSQFGTAGTANAGMAPQPTTVEPSMLFSTSSSASTSGPSGFAPMPVASGSGSSNFASTSNSTPGLTIGSTSASSGPSVSAAPSGPASVAADDADEDDDALISIEPHEQSRSSRADSSFSYGGDDLNAMSRLDRLAPLSSIFSAGKGKGGKKGGGLSSVVRQEDEDIDDDDSWRPSPEEYKKLSSKEKRQLRNKLSARAFRNRRKDYIGTLEGHIKERDGVIDEMRSELVSSRTENQDLRKELAALKASTMGILHPKSAVNTETPPILQAFALSSNLPSAGPSQPKKSAPTPVFNPRKDIGVDSKTRWGNENLFGGGSTICHTILTTSSDNTAPAMSPFDMPRANINPRLSSFTPAPISHTANLQATADGKDLANASFADWSENNAFSIRSMDSYRMQMWGRLAREAASDKAGLSGAVRPKFLVEPTTPPSEADSTTPTAAQLAAASAAHITSKLAASFWSAFQTPSSRLDTDKLTSVVTGKARLRVMMLDDEDEKKQQAAQEDMIAALGGLKLQAGKEAGWREVQGSGSGIRAREDPLRALGGLFGLGMGMPTRA